MKGIVLAGGSGKRLYPITQSISKQLLLIYDKPLIYYSISTLMLANIREILIIVSPLHLETFQRLLGDGRKFGLNIVYGVQPVPRGIADAFIVGEKFVKSDSVCLILGDNIFYGQGLGGTLEKFTNPTGANIFAYKVSDPKAYGVVELDTQGQVISLEEKPRKPRSNWAITGLYFYNNSVIEKSKNLSPSFRGELEITDINSRFLAENNIQVTSLERGTAWFDAGTFESINMASNFIKAIEERQGFKIACLEEIAYKKKWITDIELANSINEYAPSPYSDYIESLLKKI